MKLLRQSITALVLTLPMNAAALERIVTIEGPVQVVEKTSVPGATEYVVETPQRERYHVVIPESEANEFATIIRQSPQARISFDGTVVDNDGERILTAQRWRRVTTTTTTTDALGRTVERHTTVEEPR